MSKQITNQIVMVRPVSFYFDTETAANDFFQKNLGEKRDVVQAKALIEFDAMVDLLRSKAHIGQLQLQRQRLISGLSGLIAALSIGKVSMSSLM